MNIAIIGSGTSGIIVAKTFLEYNYKVHLIDSENFTDDIENKLTAKFLPSLKRSPKFDNKPLIKSIKKFKKNII